MEPPDLLAELERKVQQLQAFNDIGRTLAGTLDIDEVLSLIMQKVSEVLRPGHWSLLLVDEERQELRFQIAVGEGADRLKDLRLPVGEGVAGSVAATGEPLLVPDVRADPRFAARFDDASGIVTGSLLAVPLRSKGRVLGVVELVNPRGGHPFDPSDQRTLEALADYAAIAIDNARAYERIRELTLRDEHTGLFNSRHMWHQLEQEVERTSRTRRPFSIIFIDLDHFKRVNDTWGHQAGSQVLLEVGQLLRSAIRTIDVPVRYGGDEFVVLLPETDQGVARAAAERIRARLAETRFLASSPPGLGVTASFGVATCPDDGDSAGEVVQAADAAMYRVKATTRNAVAQAGDDGRSPPVPA
ncbi:MAG: sensor domain-containing diguanylate cyclase [Deltaproteobacteria bacterium]